MLVTYLSTISPFDSIALELPPCAGGADIAIEVPPLVAQLLLSGEIVQHLLLIDHLLLIWQIFFAYKHVVVSEGSLLLVH